ncbi:RNA polymerase sigma factor [Temperatibacter marinus]|uniref:RNA polymerase sigma factor n=1 Tax=Temperatibacter marinus TaxID=1456591 RepID=A0AA52H8R9_9PROT|nr:RNA polymerase sigma factor [Temperatibacter marinus]WND01747.1 RNA polymerase sigma factor [Temperatibacter marinus]
MKATILFFPKKKEQERHDMLAVIFKEHSEAIKRFLRMRQLTVSDADDLLQDLHVRLAAMEDLTDRLGKSPDTVRSYLFAIASNLIKDKYRRAQVRQEGKHQNIEESVLPLQPITPETVLEGRQNIFAVEKVLKKQKSNCRKAFEMSRFEDKSYREIADELSISVSSVEKYISRVLYALRQELGS